MRLLPEKILVISFALALPALVIWKILPPAKVLGTAVEIKKDYSTEIAFWQSEVIKYPDYRDGYLKLAQAYKNSGDIDQARLALQQALQIDPNFQVPLQLVDLQ